MGAGTDLPLAVGLSYLVAGITCLAVLVIAKRAWWPLIPSLVLGASFFVQSATLDRSTEIVGSKPLL